MHSPRSIRLTRCSLGCTTGESLEALDVILALGDWVLLLVVLVAFLHSFKHLGAFWVRHIERFTSEVGGKIVTELWHGGGDHTGSHVLGPSTWSWWKEGSRVIQFESLKVWMFELARAHNHTALEWMSRDHDWVSVVYRKKINQSVSSVSVYKFNCSISQRHNGDYR